MTDVSTEPFNEMVPCGIAGSLNVQVAAALPEGMAAVELAGLCARAAAGAAAGLGLVEAWEAGVRIGDADEGRALNRDFRGKDYATNVLSFPNEDEAEDADARYAGDLFICLPVLVREAAEQEKPLVEHLQHLVVHGMLHLHGHDHLTPVEAEAMEALEVEILQGLGVVNPYDERLYVVES